MSIVKVTVYDGETIVIRGCNHGVNHSGLGIAQNFRTVVKVTFEQRVYAVVELGERDNHIFPMHLRTARAFKPGLHIDTLANWQKQDSGRFISEPKIMFLCQRQAERLRDKYQYAWGGSDHILLYEDEVFVPDYKMAGTKGWALTMDELIYIINGGQ